MTTHALSVSEAPTALAADGAGNISIAQDRGAISAGSPTALGTFTFDVTASNRLGTSTPLSVSLIVRPGLRPPGL